MLAHNAFGSQELHLKEPLHILVLRVSKRRSIKTTNNNNNNNATVSAVNLPLLDQERKSTASRHLFGFRLSSLAPADDWQLCGSEFSTGMAGGQAVGGRCHREQGHILAPERTNSNNFL